jgi:hypothetical protein
MNSFTGTSGAASAVRLADVGEQYRRGVLRGRP